MTQPQKTTPTLDLDDPKVREIIDSMLYLLNFHWSKFKEPMASNKLSGRFARKLYTHTSYTDFLPFLNDLHATEIIHRIYGRDSSVYIYPPFFWQILEMDRCGIHEAFINYTTRKKGSARSHYVDEYDTLLEKALRTLVTSKRSPQ